MIQLASSVTNHDNFFFLHFIPISVECFRRALTAMAGPEYGYAAGILIHNSECWACAGLRA